MRKLVNLMTIAIMVIVLISGCFEGNSTVDIEFKNEGKTYPTGEFHTYTVQLSDRSGAPVTADSVTVYMNMERMNHPVTAVMEYESEGIYYADLPLAMEGEWYAEITVHHDGSETEEVFTVFAEGEMIEEFMRGYDAETGGPPGH